jgi:SAM-dependent methyltransferase
MSRSAPAQVRFAAERRVGRLIFGSRAWLAKRIAEVVPSLAHGRVLEIGSGRHDFGDDAYSLKAQFPGTCDFVQSDVNPGFGHLVVDVTSMDFDGEFDAILCMSVLEHVERFWEAIPRMRRALKPGGKLVMSVPMCFPYHDEPADYYRFTTHGVRFLLREFSDVQIRYRGARRVPFTVFAVAVK